MNPKLPVVMEVSEYQEFEAGYDEMPTIGDIPIEFDAQHIIPFELSEAIDQGKVTLQEIMEHKAAGSAMVVKYALRTLIKDVVYGRNSFVELSNEDHCWNAAGLPELSPKLTQIIVDLTDNDPKKLEWVINLMKTVHPMVGTDPGAGVMDIVTDIPSYEVLCKRLEVSHNAEVVSSTVNLLKLLVLTNSDMIEGLESNNWQIMVGTQTTLELSEKMHTVLSLCAMALSLDPHAYMEEFARVVILEFCAMREDRARVRADKQYVAAVPGRKHRTVDDDNFDGKR